MNTEDNKEIPESKDTREMNKDPKEYSSTAEFREISEMKDTSEENTKAIDKLKKNPKMAAQATVAASVIGIASFVVIATSGLVNVTMDGAFAEENGIVFRDDGLEYNITVSDVEKDNDIFFEVFNGKESLMKYTIEFDHPETYNGDLNGYFSLSEVDIPKLMEETDDLVLDVHLCGNTGLVDRTYDSWSLEVKAFESVFNSVSYGCDCANSGCFKFTMDFSDDYGQFSSFDASITDSLGTVRRCTFTDDLHDTQSIFVMDLAGGDAIFRLTFHNGSEIITESYDVVI